MDYTMISALFGLTGLFIGIILMIILNQLKITTSLKKSELIINEAKDEADKIKKDYLLEAKEQAKIIKLDTDSFVKDKKQELKESEERLILREANMDKRDLSFQNRELMLEEKENNLVVRQKQLQDEYNKVEDVKLDQVRLLEEISGISKSEARDLVMSNVEEMMSLETASYIKESLTSASLEVDKKAKDMLVSSMQRYAADVSNLQTVTVVNLASDDMKGRIIGREGRNIRSIEAITGIDLIIDDTPEAIVLSSFDPFRREIARITIETLLKDGRIHPGRIEEVYDKTVLELNDKVLEYASEALFELGITKVDLELQTLLGKLHFRTSFGQSVLQHSVEVAHLAGVLAAELGLNVALAKRAGLFHDIGKSIDHEVEGSHVDIGVNLATKYGENEVVINAIASHHGDVESTSIISSLVGIADALSASRPGARNNSLENYIQRLHNLENIANNIDGVVKSYAMQAGRELRVIVSPSEVDDIAVTKIAREIKTQIEATLQYPGVIKVVVIRETRVLEEAK